MAIHSLPKRILLAEDNPADVFLVRQAIQAQHINCEITAVSDGEQAIAVVTNPGTDATTPVLDLVLLDLHLPRHDGEEVLKHLRSSERYAQTPVIILTSSSSPYEQESVERHGPVHYFRKPSTLDEFMELGVIVKAALDEPAADRLPGQSLGVDSRSKKAKA